MNKIKNYAIIVLTVFVLLLAWQYKSMRGKRDKERATAERWQGNFMDQLKQNRTIVLTYKEWMKVRSDSIARLMDSLKIKPKTVTKYEQTIIDNSVHDTIYIPTKLIGKLEWEFNDTINACTTYSGIVKIITDSLTVHGVNVKRTAFNDTNILDAFYHWRQKGRFLFWKTYYKDKIDMTSVPKCGVATTKTVEILK